MELVLNLVIFGVSFSFWLPVIRNIELVLIDFQIFKQVIDSSNKKYDREFFHTKASYQ